MYTLTDMGRDSKKVMKSYRYHKFQKTLRYKLLVLMTIPLILLGRTKRSKSVIIALSLVASTSLYA